MVSTLPGDLHILKRRQILLVPVPYHGFVGAKVLNRERSLYDSVFSIMKTLLIILTIRASIDKPNRNIPCPSSLALKAGVALTALWTVW